MPASSGILKKLGGLTETSVVLGNTVAGLATWWRLVFLSEYVIIGTTLTNFPQRKVFQLVASWLWHVLDWWLMSCPLVLPGTSSEHSLLVICFRGRSLDTTERHLWQEINAKQEWETMNDFRFATHKCKTIHCTAPRSRTPLPLWGLGANFCPWRSQRSSLGCGGTPNSHLRSTLMC